ncbi:MAG TPA: type IV pilus secretin PilQ, partial [Deltaproteobacteria bacterium]|nr:type IV pilus secretin PilQ [Deltaproteobacteria bacterium]
PAEVVEGAFKKEETVEEAAASGEPVPAPRVDTGPVVAGFGPGVESVVSVPPRPTAGPGSEAAATEAEGVPAEKAVSAREAVPVREAVSAKEAAPVAAAESPPPAPSAGFGPAEVVEGAFKKEETVEEAAASGEPVPAPRVDTGPVVAGFGPGVESVVSIPPRPTAGPGSAAAATEAEAVPAKKAVPVREAVSAKEAAPAAAAAPAPKPAAPPAASKAASFEDKTMAVKDVRFERLRDTARVVVEGSRRPRYRVTESLGGRKITVDFDGAVIPKALERTLDATKLGTPVLKISSYQAMTEPEKRVRLLIFVRQKVPYDILEDRGNLYIDFPLAGPPVEEAAAGVKTPVGEGAPSAEAAEAAEAGGAGGDAEGAERRYTGRRIDIDMVDANISDVLKLLAEVSNLNIITGDDVVGTITLRLKNVPWDQAFDIILRTKNLDKVQEGNIIWVAPADKIKQEKAAALEAKQAEEKLEELKIHLIPVNYATASDLLSQVREVMSERGTVTSEDRTNTLIIKDIQKSIDAARELVARLDTPIPQVLIEARIVEASTSFARDLGVQWGIDYKNLTDSVLTHSFGTTATTGLTTQNYAVSLPATGTAGSLGGIGLTIGKLAKNPLLLDLSLSAGEQSGLLKTISRPRITTLDNREAVIEQGEEIPFETTSATGTATTFKKANLSLTVTPHITPDGSVLMKIKATRNSLGTFRTQSGEPSINTKEASTEVLVRDGETTVIGGIIISDSSRTTKGIPFMKDIPLLGWLFKSKSVSDSQSELLIFITPKIVKSHGS